MIRIQEHKGSQIVTVIYDCDTKEEVQMSIEQFYKEFNALAYWVKIVRHTETQVVFERFATCD